MNQHVTVGSKNSHVIENDSFQFYLRIMVFSAASISAVKTLPDQFTIIFQTQLASQLTVT